MTDMTDAVLDVAHLSSMTGADASLGIEIIDIFRQQTAQRDGSVRGGQPAGHCVRPCGNIRAFEGRCVTG